MNKWFYRAVGTVGVASGFLMLAGGVAQADGADATAQPAVDPQQLRGALDTFLTPTAGALPLTPTAGAPTAGALPLGAPGADRVAGAGSPTDVLGNDMFLPAALSPATLADITRNLPLGQVPALPAATGTPAGAALPAVTGSPDGEALSAATGTPAGAALGTLPLRSADAPLPVRNDQLNADPALGMLPPGLLPSDVRPTVQTGTLGTELPGTGPVGVDTANGTAQLPALIGDTMKTQQSDLPGAVRAPAESDAPLLGSLPVLGGLSGTGLPGSLPALDNLGGARGLPAGGATRDLPVGGVTRDLTRPARPAGPTGSVHDAAQTATRPAGAGRHAAPRPGRHAAKPGRHAASGNRAGAPIRRVAGSPTGPAAERPVAGEDVDFR